VHSSTNNVLKILSKLLGGIAFCSASDSAYSVVCPSLHVVCHIHVPCLNRWTGLDLDIICYAHLWGLNTK